MRIAIETILEAVSEHFNITRVELFKNTRKRDIVVPRQIFFYFCWKHSKDSLRNIGETALEYGRKTPYDHATVLHGKKTIEGLLTWDKKLEKEMEIIEQDVFAKYKKLQFDSFYENQKTNQDKRVQYWMMCQKYKSIIKKIRDENKRLKHQMIRNIEVNLQAI